MTTLELTRETTGWEKVIADHIAAGDRVEVRIETPMLSPAEFGAQVGLSRTAVKKWIDRGKIAAERRGTYWHIPASEVERFRQWYVMEMATAFGEDYR